MKNHAVCTIAGLGLLCAAVISGELSAAIIHVPGDQPTIQAAVDAATSGDLIMVAAGTFSGPGNRDIDFTGKELAIEGQGIGQTIIDCGGSAGEYHGGFYFHSAEDSSMISRLEIINAYYGLSHSDKGAITCWGSSPVITDCAIRNNHSHGISINGASSPELVTLQISSNAGWGISMPGYPYLSVGVNVLYSQIDHNALGGMILTRAVEATRLALNTFADNGGYGLFLQGDLPLASSGAAWDTTTIIEQNVFAFNADRGIYFMSFYTGVHYRNNLTFGNGGVDILGLTPDTSCLLSADPRFCRNASPLPYSVGVESPCLAENNVCGIEIGAYGVTCSGCCMGFRGNVDCDSANLMDISDLTRMIDYQFITFEPLCCFDAANMDGEGSIDIGDLTNLIDYLYISTGPTLTCP